MVTVTLGLDVLALAPRSMPASCIGPDLLQPALLAQLHSMQTLLLSSPVSPSVPCDPRTSFLTCNFYPERACFQTLHASGYAR